MKSQVLERFLRYVAYDTQSSEASMTTPSTEKQLALGQVLAEELKNIGMTSVFFDDFGYVYGTLAPTEGREAEAPMGLVAHMDTSPDASGAGIKPRLMPEYDGGDILLNQEKRIVLSPTAYPSLKALKGQTLVVTDGTTLLGADDKAGAAEIMTALAEVIAEGIPHGKIFVAFTPDEEIGKGTAHFDLSRFQAAYAYTVDGGALGELEYECFHAASAQVTFYGVNIHPGDAKDKMRNAALLAMDFNGALPKDETPAHTEGYQGFFHLTQMEGSVEKATLQYIIRDHDKRKFSERKALLEHIALTMEKEYGKGTVALSVKDSYHNMREKIEPHMEIVKKAENAMKTHGITPLVQPIRGGTDGAALSFMGIPTPNLSAGGYYFHSCFELIPLESMTAMVAVLKTLIEGEIQCY